MTYDEFINEAIKNKTANPEWRWGQTYYNTLWEINSNLATHIARSDADPFYRDDAIPLFLTVVHDYYEAFESIVDDRCMDNG